MYVVGFDSLVTQLLLLPCYARFLLRKERGDDACVLRLWVLRVRDALHESRRKGRATAPVRCAGDVTILHLYWQLTT
jgi:hypothetical protein